MRALPSIAVLALAVIARAQDAPPAAAASVDPVQEARDLIEVAPNTKENLKKGIAIYESKITDAALPAKVRANWRTKGPSRCKRSRHHRHA